MPAGAGAACRRAVDAVDTGRLSNPLQGYSTVRGSRGVHAGCSDTALLWPRWRLMNSLIREWPCSNTKPGLGRPLVRPSSYISCGCCLRTRRRPTDAKAGQPVGPAAAASRAPAPAPGRCRHCISAGAQAALPACLLSLCRCHPLVSCAATLQAREVAAGSMTLLGWLARCAAAQSSLRCQQRAEARLWGVSSRSCPCPLRACESDLCALARPAQKPAS